METLLKIYQKLLDLYGPMGWWPLSYRKETPNGYHPGEYGEPSSAKGRWEVYTGAILTQNTAWKNVRAAISNLMEAKALSPEAVCELSQDNLAELIKPSGYFNQKAKKLKIAADFFLKKEKTGEIPTRDELLSLWGIGEETADTIRLYACHQPDFVIDAYTKRIFTFLGILSGGEDYRTVKALFEENLPRDVILYKEYHALIVNHAKNYYFSKKSWGEGDPLVEILN